MWSSSISGVGFGSTIEQAKKEALADVISNIGGMVSSSFSQTQIINGNNIAENNRERIIKVDQNYPLLMPTFSQPEQENEQYKITATIDGLKSAKQYINQMAILDKGIKLEIAEAEKQQDTRLKIELYENVISQMTEFEKYSTMASILDIKNTPILMISPSVIENEIAKLSFQNNNNDLIKYDREEFVVKLKSDRSDSNRVLPLGEHYELFLQVSHRGYFYMINHSINDNNESYSYLVEFDENSQNIGKFITEIKNNQINGFQLVNSKLSNL